MDAWLGYLVGVIALAYAGLSVRSVAVRNARLRRIQAALVEMTHHAESRALDLDLERQRARRLESDLYVARESLAIVERRTQAQSREIDRLKTRAREQEDTSTRLRAELRSAFIRMNEDEARLHEQRLRASARERELAASQARIARELTEYAQLAERFAELRRDCTTQHDPLLERDEGRHLLERLGELDRVIAQLKPLVDGLAAQVSSPAAPRGTGLRLVHDAGHAARGRNDMPPELACPDDEGPPTIPNLRPVKR